MDVGGAQSESNLDLDSFAQLIRVLAASGDESSQVEHNMLSLLQLSDKSMQGVAESFLDTLERVDPKHLPNSETHDCPICTNKFVDDPHPLVVKLPCTSVRNKNRPAGKDHMFDLECIGPWLKINATCPLCRYNMNEHEQNWRKELKKMQEEDDEEEEDGWDVYG